MFFFKRKKQNDQYFLFSLFGVIILSLILGMFIGIKLDKSKRLAKSKVQKALQTENLPKQVAKLASPGRAVMEPAITDMLHTASNQSHTVPITISGIDVYINPQSQSDPNEKSYVSYNANNQTYSYKAIIDNQGSQTANNVAYEVKNETTGQIIANGTFGQIAGGRGITTSQTSIRANPQLFEQGNHSVKIKITNPTLDANPQNNTYQQTNPPIRIPVVNLNLTNPINIVSPANNQTRLQYTIPVMSTDENGNPRIERNTNSFKVNILKNLTNDGERASNGFSTNNNVTTQNLAVPGVTATPDGYHFIEVLLDQPSQVEEYNESRNLAETDNTKKLELKKFSNSLEHTPYTASSNWFMKYPTINLGNGASYPNIELRYLNISNQTITHYPIFKLYADKDCLSTLIKTVSQEGKISNARREYSAGFSGFTSAELATMNNSEDLCIEFVSDNKGTPERLKRSFKPGFADAVIDPSNPYSVSITRGQQLQNPVKGNYLILVDAGFTHTIKVKNQGKGKMTNVKVKVYTNGQFDGEGTIANIEPNSSMPITISPRNNVLDGYNIVKIVLEADNSTLETNENNNIGLYEVKVENNQIVGTPILYPAEQDIDADADVNESINATNVTDKTLYYLYRPHIDDSNPNGRKYHSTVVRIAEGIASPYVRFNNKYTVDNGNPYIDAEGIQQSWNRGQFKTFEAGLVSRENCYTSFKFQTSTNNDNTYETQSIFKNSDIAPNNPCVN